MILHLIIRKEWHDKILSGEKNREFRSDTPHYRARLIRSGRYRKFTIVRLQVGYNRNATVTDHEFLGVRKQNGVFVIRLGKILNSNQ